MSFQAHSKAAIIITFSFGTILLPSALQAHKSSVNHYKKESFNKSSATDANNNNGIVNRDKSRKADDNSNENKNIYWNDKEITVIGKAERLAPSSVPLNIIQPTSIVQSAFMANNIIPLASVDDIIKYQPSVWTQNPNGPGIGKAETMSLRGFQDGQYNMTFDGIPFGDASDLHHSTSSLFIAHFLGQAEVDRGPGTASTIGDATFGGTIGFTSRTPASKFGITPYGTYGS